METKTQLINLEIKTTTIPPEELAYAWRDLREASVLISGEPADIQDWMAMGIFTNQTDDFYAFKHIVTRRYVYINRVTCYRARKTIPCDHCGGKKLVVDGVWATGINIHNKAGDTEWDYQPQEGELLKSRYMECEDCGFAQVS